MSHPSPEAVPAAPRNWFVPAIAALVVFCVAFLLLPKAPSLSKATVGDAALAQRVRQLVGNGAGYQSLEVVEVTAGSVTNAGLGDVKSQPGQPTPQTPYQLGSVTKTFNGLLLADAVQRGEVRLDQPVAELIPELAGSDVGSVTLQELATHRSGLPSILPTGGLRAMLHPFSLRDPYAPMTSESLIADLKDYKIAKRGSMQYSNTGASLLGHALARASKSPDWPALVKARIFDPLGMTNTGFCLTPQAVPASGATGFSLSGRVPEPWCTEGQTPAGASTWTTAEDLTKYAQALLGGTAPGLGALEPQPGIGSETTSQRGLHWVILHENNQTITWHNGGVAGGRTFFGLDRAAGKAVIVLGNTDREVDSIALGLLEGSTTPLTWDAKAEREIPGLAVLALVAVFVATLGNRALRVTSRTQLITSTLDTGTALLLTYVLPPWIVAPWVMLPLFIAVAVGCLLLAAQRWRDLPMTRRRIGGWVAVGFSALAFVIVLSAMLFG